MINRDIQNEFTQLVKEYPVITILGPRQAGKTTLAIKFLKNYEYVNLEIPEVRDFAISDPQAFLKQLKQKVILDEIQRAPILLSYIQAIVDKNQINGQFILTGSHQLELKEAVTQSLAGRTGILNLLPLSISELTNAKIEFSSFEEYAFHGFLPRIYDQKQRPTQAYSNYYQTYVERDVRQLINLKNAGLFEKFLKLLAGRAGQIIDYTSLGNDVGVNSKTIKEWLSILEASFIVYKLDPYFENFGKRVIKSPKYYFTDVGLLCYLLGIENQTQITRDPLIGNIFENLVVIECLKSRLNQGKMPHLYFFRDTNQKEIDIVFQDGRDLVAIEIKAASTFNQALLKNIQLIKDTIKIKKSYLIYNGTEKKLSNGTEVLNFKSVGKIFG
jgi:predicted AAA+ superfamily ATPase